MHIIQAEIGAPKITTKILADNHALFVVLLCLQVMV